jgi:acetyl-CoA acetyltransferase
VRTCDYERRKNGTITAGNAPGLNSGAAAMIVTERGWLAHAERNRKLAVSQIIADAMDERGTTLPPTRVDIADIRRKYHAAGSVSHGGRSKAAGRAKSC